MKNIKSAAKKFLCVMLAVIMIVPIGGVLQAFAATCNCPNDPYVYIQGQGSVYVRREDGSVHVPLDEDSYDTKALVKEILPLLLDAVKTGDWTEYGNALYNMISQNYQEIKVNPDGTVQENTRAGNWSWNENTIYSRHTSNMAYSNHYVPEWRFSPMDVADDINAYIETVKRKTGHDKVNLVGRCMGGSYLMAYLQKYGYESVNSVTFIASIHNGGASAQALISGNVKIDSDGIIRYLSINSDAQDQIGGDLVEYLILTINALREIYTDEIVVYLFQELYNNIKDSTFAPLMREYYGVGGCMTSVNEDFEDAMKFLYPTDELKEEYANQIAKAKDFHYNVQLKTNDILSELEANGVPVFTIAEYGFQQVAVGGEKTNTVGEKTVGAERQSNGATVSNVNSVLTDSYIKSREEAGFASYISPDKQIDASTCLIPERTWFIKNLNHTFPNAVHSLINYLVFSPTAPTVNTNPNYPQFMLYQTDEAGRESLVKLTKENSDTINWNEYEKTTGQANKLLNMIVNLFKGLLNGFLGKIFAMVDQIKATFKK